MMPELKKPCLMAVTMREGEADEVFLKKIEEVLKNGTDILELREKNITHDRLVALAREVKNLTDRYQVPLIINDYPDIAKEVDADGVHLGIHDTSIKAAREILGAGKIIGVSAYNSIERALRAEYDGADYVAMSSPFPSAQKPLKKNTPFEIIAETKKRLRIPLFVIGGIFPSNARRLLNLGIFGIAVMGGIFLNEKPGEVVREFKKILNEYR